ncbi:MAG: RND family transporter [Chitinispirillaceae bacterium]|nr:RND family transporter [Chitinispirillaceae bacterium]
MKSLSELIVRFRWAVILLFFGVTAFFALQIPKLEIDTDIKSHLPKDMPSRLDTDHIDKLFGGTEMLMVLVQTDDVITGETLARVKKLSRKIKRIKGVDKVMSLFDLQSIKSDNGMMVVDPAVKKIPKNDAEREEIRSEITGNDLVYGSVVSRDFSVTAIIAMLKTNTKDEEIVPEFLKVIEEVPGNETVQVGGLPLNRFETGIGIRKDMRLLLPLGILIMLLFLYGCFRRIRGVLMPFIVTVMSIIVSIGIISLIGWKFQMVTVILPIFLIAVANNYGIHMITKYQEDNVPSNNFSKKELAKRMFQSLGKPVLLTGLTTMAGMLCLIGHIMVPAKELGILSAIGILFALLASLFFIPAFMSFLPRSKPVLSQIEENHKKKPVVERLLWLFGEVISRHPKKVLSGLLLFALVSSIGIFRVVVDTNPNSYYPPDHPTVKVNNIIDEHLGGSQNVAIVYEGDIKDPKIMNKIDKTEHALAEMEEIGTTISIARVLRMMSRTLNDLTSSHYDKIPETRDGIAQYFELYAMSGDPDDFNKLVDFPQEHAIVTARINKTSTAVLSGVIPRIKKMVQGDPDVLLVGGFGVVLSDLAEAVVKGQLLSLILAIVICAVLIMLLFRSFNAGIISAIPLLFSIVILFGLMGVFGIELNIVTALLSSIMIGVGIDYTIHFLWRYREERRSRLDAVAAVKKTLATTGRGITFNAFSVMIGFIALFFSAFLPVRFFGFLVVVSIFACLIGALVLVPALVLIWKPRFLEGK